MTNSKEKNELALKEMKYFLNEYNNKQISIYELMENIMALGKSREFEESEIAVINKYFPGSLEGGLHEKTT